MNDTSWPPSRDTNIMWVLCETECTINCVCRRLMGNVVLNLCFSIQFARGAPATLFTWIHTSYTWIHSWTGFDCGQISTEAAPHSLCYTLQETMHICCMSPEPGVCKPPENKTLETKKYMDGEYSMWNIPKMKDWCSFRNSLFSNTQI